jgi:hypothetical protein
MSAHRSRDCYCGVIIIKHVICITSIIKTTPRFFQARYAESRIPEKSEKKPAQCAGFLFEKRSGGESAASVRRHSLQGQNQFQNGRYSQPKEKPMIAGVMQALAPNKSFHPYQSQVAFSRTKTKPLPAYADRGFGI